MQSIDLAEKETEEFICKSQREENNFDALNGCVNDHPQKSIKSQSSSESEMALKHPIAGGKESPRKKTTSFLHKFFK